MPGRRPLTLPPLAAAGVKLQRSGFRWTCQDGQLCRTGDVVAFCNIATMTADVGTGRYKAFFSERYEFQAALMLAVDGRIRIGEGSSRGGFLDRLPRLEIWQADMVIGHLEPAEPIDGGAPLLRVMIGAGRRVMEHAEVRSGFLTGWHMRNRAWWADGPTVEGTLLGIGSCDIASILVGDGAPFVDMLRLTPSFAHIVMQPDQALAPCTPVMLQQIDRAPEQGEAIMAAFKEEMHALATTPTAADWMFGGLLLASLLEKAFDLDADLLSGQGLHKTDQADAVLISMLGEPRRLLRHRRLGYLLHFHGYRREQLSPVMAAWLRANFEPVRRTLDDVKRDLSTLGEKIKGRGGGPLIVMNALSSSGNEEIGSYRPFDAPMGETIASVHNKEVNLVLHDLVREGAIALLDQDAIIAEIGAQRNLPDGAHQSGVLQAALRQELLCVLDQHAVPGFRRPP